MNACKPAMNNSNRLRAVTQGDAEQAYRTPHHVLHTLALLRYERDLVVRVRHQGDEEHDHEQHGVPGQHVREQTHGEYDAPDERGGVFERRDANGDRLAHELHRRAALDVDGRDERLEVLLRSHLDDAGRVNHHETDERPPP